MREVVSRKIATVLFGIFMMAALSPICKAGGDEEGDVCKNPPEKQSNSKFYLYEMNVDMTVDPAKSKYLESYVDLDFKKTPPKNLSSFSYCFRFEFLSLNYQCLFYEGNPDVKVNFPEPSKDYGFVYFLGHAFIFTLPQHVHIYPKEWYHMCVSHELKSNQKMIKAYFNGHKIVDATRSTTKQMVKFNDKWTLGYCKYYKYDGHTVLSPLTTVLRGAISDFNLWSKALNENEMTSFTKTCTRPGLNLLPAADLINWDDMKHIVEAKCGGNSVQGAEKRKRSDSSCLSSSKSTCVELGDAAHLMMLTWVCRKRSVSTLIFETNTAFNDAMSWCNQLGGNIPIPKTRNETIALSKLLREAIRGKYACEHFWIPIMHGPKPERKDVNGATMTQDKGHTGGSASHKRKRRGASEATDEEIYEVKKAMDGDEQPFVWTEYFNDKRTPTQPLDWDAGQPDGWTFQPCVTLDIHTCKYHDQSCTEPTFCGFCQFDEPVHYYLRGVQKEYSWDEEYVFVPHDILLGSYSVELTGYHNQVIKLHPPDDDADEKDDETEHKEKNDDSDDDDDHAEWLNRRRREATVVDHMKTSSSAFAGTAINTWEIFDSQKGIIGKLQQPSKLKISPMGKRVWIPVSDGTETTSYKKDLKLTKV